MFTWAQVKKSLILQLLISYTFLVSGLIINSLELLTFVFIRPFSRYLYDYVNYFLALMMWGNLTAMAQWWSGSDFVLYCSEETLKNIGKENAISVLNHKYEIDWLCAWLLCQRTGLLGGTKVFNKSATKYLPIIGWSFWFNNMLFLSREWTTDQKSLVVGIDRILQIPKDIPFNLSILAEGTRFSDDKHAASMEVATSKGLPHLKHHLLPRTKGFTLLCNAVNNRIEWLYDITLAIPKVNGTQKPSLKLIKDGVPIDFQMYIRRIPLSSVPLDEKTSAEWLQKLYQEKDAIFDIFDKTGSFAETDEIKKHYIKKNNYDLFVACFWIVVIALPSVYCLLLYFVNGSWIAKLTLIGIFALVNLVVKYLVNSTDSNRASSHGISPIKKKE